MTSNPIDASLRRAILADQDQGNVIPDSRRKLAENPLAILDPGTEDLSIQFTDKKGLTDAYGNVYQGYGTSGSTFRLDEPQTIDSEADDADDGDILVFTVAEQKYLPYAYEEVGLPRVSISDLPDADRNILIYNFSSGYYEPQTYFEAGLPEITNDVPNAFDVLAYDTGEQKYKPTPLSFFDVIVTNGDDPDEDDILVWDEGTGFWVPRQITWFPVVLHDGTAPAEGDILIYKAGPQRYSPGPQTITDWIMFLIEKPVNRQYRFAESLPFDITVTGTMYVMEAGPGSVSFPSGTIAAGSPAFITVSGTSGASSFLRVQIRYTRSLGLV